MYKRKTKLSPIHISLIALAILVVIAVIVTFAVKKDEPKEPTIAAIAAKASAKPSTQPATAIPMEAGRNIPAVSTGAKPIAGTAVQRTTIMLRTA